jgi:phage-related protein
MVIEGKSFGELDKTDIVVAGAIGAIFPGAVKGLSEFAKAGTGVSKNMAAISKLQRQAANTPNRAGKILSGIEKNVTEAAKKVGDAGSTAALAATGGAAKGAVQEVVNNRQEASNSSGSNSSSNPGQVDPPPQDKLR